MLPTVTDVVMFTDWSKTDEWTGAGACSEELDLWLSTPLGSYTTVFQSEIIAICESLQEMLNIGVKDKRILK